MNFNNPTDPHINNIKNNNWQFKHNFSIINKDICKNQISNDLFKKTPIRFMDPRQNNNREPDFYEKSNKLTITNLNSSKFQNSFANPLVDRDQPFHLNLNNQEYLYPATNQEEYICNENYIENEYYDYEDDDVISLNVDFTIDDINEDNNNTDLIVMDENVNKSVSKVTVGSALPPPPPSTRPITINKKPNQNNTANSNIKIDLNPDKYTLELSTLSSSSLSSISSSKSKKSLPSNKLPIRQRVLNISYSSSSSISSSFSTSISNLSKCKDFKQTRVSNESIVSSFDSSITYYDDFYVSSKLKRNKSKEHKINKLKHSASVYLKKSDSQDTNKAINEIGETLSSFDLSNKNQTQKLSSKSFNNKDSSSKRRYSKRKSKKLNDNRFDDNSSIIGVVNNEPNYKSNLNLNNNFIINFNSVNTLPKKKYGGIKTTLKTNLDPSSPNRNLEKLFSNEEIMFNNHLYENVYTMSKENQRIIVKEQQKEQIRKEIDNRNMIAMRQQQFLLKTKKTPTNTPLKYTNKQPQLSMASINLLDDYLLIKIFSKLNTIEKLQLQFVCKRWHQIIWSNHNTYKLFNRIEIVESQSTLHSKSIQELNQTINTSSTAANKSSTLSKLFRSKKSKANINSNAPDTNTLARGYRAINADLVFKFLLCKMLNRQTYPLCLCVEYITIKNNNRITDRGINLIAQVCPELKYLCLRNCTNIKTSSISSLVSNCENLKYLDLTGCYNVNNIILMNKTNETHHGKPHANIKSEKTKALNGLYKKFNFYFTNHHKKTTNNQNRNDEMFKFQSNPEFSLKNISNYFYLQFVDLSYCSSINDTCIQSICKNCVFIKNLYLRRCKLITDISLLHIAKYCFNLRELSLCQCVKITDVGVKFLGNSKLICSLVPTQNSMTNMFCNVADNVNEYENFNNNITNENYGFNQEFKPINRFKIKYLSLAKCPLVTDGSLIYLCKVGFFGQIKYLNLRGCTGVTDKFMKYFTGSKMLKMRLNEERESSSLSENKTNEKLTIPCQLKSLDLAKCSITDKSLEYLCRLVAFRPNVLQRLSLRACDNITDNGVLLLALNCKQLQHLNLTKCNKLTNQSLKQIKTNCQECIVQHTNFSFC